jgi:hypothetical protein
VTNAPPPVGPVDEEPDLPEDDNAEEHDKQAGLDVPENSLLEEE